MVNQRLTAHEFTGVNLGGIPSFGSKKNPPAETGGLALVRHILLFIRAADPVAAINRHWIEVGIEADFGLGQMDGHVAASRVD